MIKRIITLLVVLCILMSGCVSPQDGGKKQYNATFLTLFDTVTTIVGYGESEADFRAKAQEIHDDLLYYHRLFDIYTAYEGVNNLKTVNDHAGVAPVTVDSAIIDLLLDCKTYYRLTDGKVNAAMGSVLRLWHDARADGMRDPTNAALPDADALKVAVEHTDFASVIIDTAASTVYITDPQMRLDVGAIAKGWAVQKAAAAAESGMLISVGGNVCATGAKPIGDAPWVIGIRDPQNEEKNLHTILLSVGSVVTSGDYQRNYVVDGKKYHHIIDPATCMPPSYWQSVTVVCEDSGLADAMSTALFLLPYDEGVRLAEQCGAEALWIDADGNEYMTPGFRELIRT